MLQPAEMAMKPPDEGQAADEYDRNTDHDRPPHSRTTLLRRSRHYSMRGLNDLIPFAGFTDVADADARSHALLNGDDRIIVPTFERSDKPIAAAGHGQDVTLLGRILPQLLAQGRYLLGEI